MPLSTRNVNITNVSIHSSLHIGAPSQITISTHIPCTSSQSRKRTRAATSLESATTSQPAPKRISIKDQRRELTESIITTLPRDALERLLLDAALGNAVIMQEVITANNLKRADGPFPVQIMEKERSLDPPNQNPRFRRDCGPSELAVVEPIQDSADGAQASSNEDLSTISTHDDTRPLQFHHITHRQFEARKAQIMDIIRRNSPQGTPSLDGREH